MARSRALPRDLLAAHVAFAQALAASDAESGEARLWAGEAGEALAEFLAELGEALGDVPPIEGRRWPALLESCWPGAWCGRATAAIRAWPSGAAGGAAAARPI